MKTKRKKKRAITINGVDDKLPQNQIVRYVEAFAGALFPRNSPLPPLGKLVSSLFITVGHGDIDDDVFFRAIWPATTALLRALRPSRPWQ